MAHAQSLGPPDDDDPGARDVANGADAVASSLAAVAALPGGWLGGEPRRVAERAAAALGRALGLRFLELSLAGVAGEPVLEVAWSDDQESDGATERLRALVMTGVAGRSPDEVVVLTDPLGGARLHACKIPLSAADGICLAASPDPGFAEGPRRLLLEVLGNHAALAARAAGAEGELGRLRATLDERVAAEIKGWTQVEESFRQAQKMETIGHLTGGIAHDFNNLLAAVLGNLQLVRKRLPDGESGLHRLVGGAIEGAERGAALTRRLLAIARHQELHPEVIDVAAHVRGTVEMLRHSVGPSIVLETDFPADLRAVRVDANQLELALLNLGLNARDAMPRGGRISFSGRNATLPADGRLAAGDYVVLAVRDTGTGMDDATLARAVEPFFTTKPPGKGVGIGLSMVHDMAEQAGGALRLSSLPGVGTVAEMLLPQAEGDPATTRAIQAMPSETPDTWTILLVDDDALVTMATSDMLRDLGHEVVEAPSAAKALEILRAGTAIDVVVTDQAMPGMTGTQLAAEIRKSWPDLPVVLATGYARRHNEGEIDVPRLVKPYSQEALSRLIGDLMRRKSGAR